MTLQEKIREMKQICGIDTEDASPTPSNAIDYTDKRRNEDTNTTELSESVATTVRQQNQNFINITRQPKTLSGGILKSYQMESLQFLLNIHVMSIQYNQHFKAANAKISQNYQINAILADEMGLGKTIQTLALFAAVYEHYGIKGRHLIVVPKSTLIQWEQEQQKWCPSFRLIKLIGDHNERQDIINSLVKPLRFDILLTTYELLRIESTQLQKIRFSYLILDEGHKLKDVESQISGVVRQLSFDHCLLLTGTPIQNNLHELWSLLNCLMPYLFNNPVEFVEVLQKAENAEQLQEILRLFMLRREKKDVETLPPKHEYLIQCPMTKLQRKIYKGILMRDLDSLASAVKSKSNDLGKTSLLNVLMQLRKCADHPYLFRGVEPEPYTDGPHLINCAGKMVVLDQLIKKILARGEKVLVFCQMTSMLNIIQDYLSYARISNCRIDGSTELEDRVRYMNGFMNDTSKYNVFLLSTRAGCLGLNLTAANHVIIYQQDFNPQVDIQAIGRVYRILQRKEVFVYRLVTENSVDVKIRERAVVKMELDQLIIQNGNFGGQDVNSDITQKANKNQLMEMIAFQTDQLFKGTDAKDNDDEVLCYDTPEITFDDKKMQELLKDASIFQEDQQKRVEEQKSKASEVIQKLANDGKLESFDVKELYQFEGQDYGKANFKRLTQQMYQEKLAKLENDQLGKRLQGQDDYQETETRDNRLYPTVTRFRRNQSLCKPDFYLLGKEYYVLQNKVLHEIKKTLEPYFAKNTDITYDQYIEQIKEKSPEVYKAKYTNKFLPGLTQDEAFAYTEYCEQNVPYLGNKDLAKRDFQYIIQSICDYDPSLYPEETGVRRIQYADVVEQKANLQNPVLGTNLFPLEMLQSGNFTVFNAQEIDVSGLEDLNLAYDHFSGCYSRGAQVPYTEQEFKMYCDQLVVKLSQLEDGARIRNRIEKARQKRQSYFLRVKSLRQYVEQYQPEPLLTMPLPKLPNSKGYTDMHDRFLLVAADIFGVGCWDEIVALIRVHPLFVFDWWFKSRDETEISQRVDKLLRGIMKSQGAIEKSAGEDE